MDQETYVGFACEDCGKEIVYSSRRCGRVEMCPHCGGYVDVPGVGDAQFVDPPANPPGIRAQASGRWTFDGNADSDRLPLNFAIATVLCLAVFPYLFYALQSIGVPNVSSFANRQMEWIVGSLRTSVPLLAIIALMQEGWQNFGIVRPRWMLDIGLGFLIWGGNMVMMVVVMAVTAKWSWASAIGSSIVGKTYPEGAFEFGLLILASAANGFAEELAIQGFLLTRLERYFGSTWKAILLATALFASYHIYQGSQATIGIAVTGIGFAWSFCLFRRLWPVCIAHALADFIGTTAV